ncbi:unnamed protein product [Parajaminaea phylloscopi]
MAACPPVADAAPGSRGPENDPLPADPSVSPRSPQLSTRPGAVAPSPERSRTNGSTEGLNRCASTDFSSANTTGAAGQPIASSSRHTPDDMIPSLQGPTRPPLMHKGDHQRSLSVKSQASSSAGATTDGASSSGMESLFWPTVTLVSRHGSVRAALRDANRSSSTLNRSGSSVSTIPTSPDSDPFVHGLAYGKSATGTPPHTRPDWDCGQVVNSSARHSNSAQGSEVDQSPAPNVATLKQNLTDLERRNKPLPPINSFDEPFASSTAEQSPIEAYARAGPGYSTGPGSGPGYDWAPDPPFVTPPLDSDDPTDAGGGDVAASPVASPRPSRQPSKNTLRAAFAQGGKYLKSSALWPTNGPKPDSRSKSPSPGLSSLSPDPPSSASLAGSTRPSPAASVSHDDLISETEESVASRESSRPARSHSPSLLKRLSRSNLRGSDNTPPPVPSSSQPSGSAGYFPIAKSLRGYRKGKSAIPRDDIAATELRQHSSSSRAQESPQDPVLPSSASPAAVVISADADQRPALMRRDRSRSLGDADLLYAGPAHVPDNSGSGGSIQRRGSVAATPSPHSVNLTLPAEGGASSFQLPDIETSSRSFMDPSRTPGRSRSISSFRWSRVLGRKNSGANSKRASQESMGESRVPASISEQSIGVAENVTGATSRARECRPQLPSTEEVSEGSIILSAPLAAPTALATAAQKETSTARDPSIKSRRHISQMQSDHAGLPSIPSPSRHARHASDSSQWSNATPLSPNLARLWSSAVDMDVEPLQHDEDASATVFHDLPSSMTEAKGLTIDQESVHDAVAMDENESVAHWRAAPVSASLLATPPRMSSRPNVPRGPSLGRTLVTVFDPRPSVEPHLFTSETRSPGRFPFQTAARPPNAMGMAPRRMRTTSEGHSRRGSLAGPSSAATSATNTPMTARTHLSHPVTPTKAAKPLPSGLSSPEGGTDAKVMQSAGGVTRGSSVTSSHRQPILLAQDVTDSASGGRRAVSTPAAAGPTKLSHSTDWQLRRQRPVSASKQSAKPLAAASISRDVRYSAAGSQVGSDPKKDRKTSHSQLDLATAARASHQTITPAAHVRQRSEAGPTAGVVASPAKSIPPRTSSQATRSHNAAIKGIKTTSTQPRGTQGRAASKSTDTGPEPSGGTMPRQRLPRPASMVGIPQSGAYTHNSRRSEHLHLHDLDDEAFLHFLEDTRRQHQLHAARLAERGPANIRSGSSGLTGGQKTQTLPDLAALSRGAQNRDPSPPSLGKEISVSVASGGGKRRPFSADGLASPRSLSIGQPQPFALHGSLDTQTKGRLTRQAQHPDTPRNMQPVISPISLALNVGHASGQAQSLAAMSSDDEWKKEVRALFIIRELLATEQSYVRHLESMLQAVRRKAIAPFASSASVQPSAPVVGRRKSVGGLAHIGAASASGSQAKISERHLPLMRNLLPQLIAVSKSLSSRIDANPTAEGVGAAFNVVAPQLEATFVAWSTNAHEIMNSLRYTQGPKAKAKDKLILIDTMASEQVELPKWGSKSQAFASQPNSPAKAKCATSLDALALTRPSSPSASPSTLPLTSGQDGTSGSQPSVDPLNDSSGSRKLSKRRSTISNVHSRGIQRAFTFGSQADSVQPAPVAKEPTKIQSPSRPTSPWGFASTRRSLAAAASKKLSISVQPPDMQQSVVGDGAGNVHGLGSNGAREPGSVLPAEGANAAQNGRSKALSVLDVAIMPMQRPPRYLLLLSELVRNTSPSSISQIRVTRSLEMMRAIARKCDEASGDDVAAIKFGLPPNGNSHDSTAVSSRSTTPSLPSRASAMLSLTAVR